MRGKLFFLVGVLCAMLTAALVSSTDAASPVSAAKGIDGVKKFEGVREAGIDNTGGMPRLLINGKPTLPLIFWYNQRQAKNYLERFQNPQLKLSSAAGVHIYGFLLPQPNYPNGIESADYSEIDKCIQSFIDVDPQALFIPRIWPGPNQGWKEWKDIPQDQISTYADGSKADKISIASPYYWELGDKGLRALIRHLEDGPYGNRMIGYNIGGPEFEMFPYQFREKGPDLCGANQLRFRTWLKGKYVTDQALRKSWGSNSVTLATAQVPVAELGRFPTHNVGKQGIIQTFYSLPAERNWVDYSEFVSDFTVDRLIDWAKLVKKETAGKKLGVFCYGYITELVCSFGGHGGLDRVLKSPLFDILMSPIPYVGRGVGDPGGFMSPVDSVAAHGKLWLNEDDMHTHLISKKDWPFWMYPELLGPKARDLRETVNLVERNFGNLLAHRATTWWTDVLGIGAFNDPLIWEMMRARMKLYREVYEHPTPYRPEVAMILDIKSKCYVKSDWDAFYWMMIDLRNQIGKSGAAMGYYSLDDFISGVTPQCKAYVFDFAFNLSDAQIRAIRERLDREGSTAVWVYASGLIGPDGVDINRSILLTGIGLAIKDGSQGSKGFGLLRGQTWGAKIAPEIRPGGGYFAASPRLYVTDKKAETLGKYMDDGLVSAARIQTGKHESVFLGSMAVSPEVFMRVFEKAGAHVWTRDGSVIQTDGTFLMVHGGLAGLKPIYLKKGMKATAIKGEIEKQEGNTIFVPFKDGDTLWFRLTSE